MLTNARTKADDLTNYEGKSSDITLFQVIWLLDDAVSKYSHYCI